MTNLRLAYDSYAALGYVQVIFHEDSGGYLVIHPKHGQNEWEENKRIGRMLVELGDAIVLLPNDLEKPSPDALRNGVEWEFKTIKHGEPCEGHTERAAERQNPITKYHLLRHSHQLSRPRNCARHLQRSEV